jgi:hypothetical protein
MTSDAGEDRRGGGGEDWRGSGDERTGKTATVERIGWAVTAVERI